MTWEEKKHEYMNKYITKNVLYKRINFSVNNPEDMELYEWVKQVEEQIGSRKLAGYLKQLIREDMNKHKT